MSHYIKARSLIKDRALLLKTLTLLGWNPVDNRSRISIGHGHLYLTQESDGTFRVEGDPYYESGKLHEYYGNIERLIIDLQTQYNIQFARQKLGSMGYHCTENEEGEVNTKEHKIQMVWESL